MGTPPIVVATTRTMFEYGVKEALNKSPVRIATVEGLTEPIDC